MSDSSFLSTHLFPHLSVAQKERHNLNIKPGIQLAKICKKGQSKKVDEIDAVGGDVGSIAIEKGSNLLSHCSLSVTWQNQSQKKSEEKNTTP
jgi:hypothetical protein